MDRMAQQVKVIAAKSGILNSVSSIHMEERTDSHNTPHTQIEFLKI